jgi:hypothetical protein
MRIVWCMEGNTPVEVYARSIDKAKMIAVRSRWQDLSSNGFKAYKPSNYWSYSPQASDENSRAAKKLRLRERFATIAMGA